MAPCAVMAHSSKPAADLTSLRLHPLLLDRVLDSAGHDMRRVEAVTVRDGVIVEARVHNRPIR